VLRLTLLAPDIVEAILNGRQPAEMTLAVLMQPFAVEANPLVLSKARSIAARSHIRVPGIAPGMMPAAIQRENVDADTPQYSAAAARVIPLGAMLSLAAIGCFMQILP
jgi:hypothetical protein